MILLLQILTNEYTPELLVFAANFAAEHSLELHVVADFDDPYDFPTCGLDAKFYTYKSIYEYLNACGVDAVAAVMHPSSKGQLFTRQQFPTIQNWYEY